MQLVVRGVRRPVRQEECEQSAGCTSQCEPQLGEGVSDPRSAEWCVRESHAHSSSQRISNWEVTVLWRW